MSSPTEAYTLAVDAAGHAATSLAGTARCMTVSESASSRRHTARRLVKDQHFGRLDQPLREQHLLLVAARQATRRAIDRAADVELLAALLCELLHLGLRDQPGAPQHP